MARYGFELRENGDAWISDLEGRFGFWVLRGEEMGMAKFREMLGLLDERVAEFEVERLRNEEEQRGEVDIEDIRNVREVVVSASIMSRFGL
jgi:hypothetical protein